MPTTAPGRYAGYDNGWVLSLITVPVIEFDKSVVNFPNIKRFQAERRTTYFRICRTPSIQYL